MEAQRMPSLPATSRVARKQIASWSLVATFFLYSLVVSTISCAEQQPSIAALYSDGGLFLRAIEVERPKQKPNAKVTGISVPHHLLAADLIARGFWAASGNTYDRIIIVSPDHFNKSRRPLATTSRNIETPLGTIFNDVIATTALLSNVALFDENDLFGQEHGIAALLPFAKWFFPDALVVPVVVSYGSTRSDWDAAVELLVGLIGPNTLVVQSTDYSHYLPHQTAVWRDQETLNAIAANDYNIVERLVQPDHMDSKGSQYIQMRLQGGLNAARGVVIANRSSAEYSSMGTKTTSYIVTVYIGEAKDGSKLRYDDQEIVYFGGDTFIGRWLTQPIARSDIFNEVIATIQSVTAGAPVVLNLEGVVLRDPPHDIDLNLHKMHADLAVPVLRSLNVVAAGLANNHSHDLGRNGLKETVRVLQQSGIKTLEHMQVLNFKRFGLIGVNFIGVRDYKNYPVSKSLDDLNEICRMKTQSPLIALVHWGDEYSGAAKPANYAAASALNSCGVNLIVGSHSHQAAIAIEALQGGEFQMVFSLGNLLFDQRGDRVSSALLELRIFKQGTIAARLIPLPNLFELATSKMIKER
jgi:AmmeMemoRadiSam system protein B